MVLAVNLELFGLLKTSFKDWKIKQKFKSIVRYLVKHGASKEARDNVKHGANKEARDNDDVSPLHIADFLDRIGIFHLDLQGLLGIVICHVWQCCLLLTNDEI